ncbi:DUF4974 domain-containing protein [Flavobacteriaceae bacterium F08102]|nr:DUF4974 domain-containing protein [Flavobacteriaceae bacterium F08102]
MHHRHKKFISLIEKWQAGKASKKELRILINYFFSHQKSNEFQETDEEKLETEQRMYKAILAELNKDTIKKKPKVKKLYLTPVVKVAIAAGIALLIALPFVLREETTSTLPSAKESIISIGTDKATLTLENGENIPLEKGKTFKNSFAESNGEELIYTGTDSIKKSTEVVYNYLTIPRGGQFYLKLNDGTKVWLNSESKLKFPVSFVENQPRSVELIYGEAYFEVSPSTAHNGTKFSVLTDVQKIEVLGTEFNVKAYSNEDAIFTTLVNGKIAWNANQQKQQLLPTQQLIFEKGTNQFSLQTVDVYNEISWRDGIFSFENKTLEEIMRILSRWYDIDVHFENPTLSAKLFNGNLSKDQHIEDILITLKELEAINNYSIYGKKVILK